jgi:hypothetical protein
MMVRTSAKSALVMRLVDRNDEKEIAIAVLTDKRERAIRRLMRVRELRGDMICRDLRRAEHPTG